MQYTFDPDENTYDQYRCFLDLLDASENQNIAEWAPVATAELLIALRDMSSRRSATKSSNGMTPLTC